MQQLYIFLSTILALISPVVYAVSILRGHSKPHRMTRFILLIITSLTTASLIARGDRVAVWLAGVSTLQSVVIFILSIPHGMGGWSKSDLWCFLIALSGIVFWQTTANPVYGLYGAIIADFVGMIPALLKTYRHPDTELWLFYGLDVFASGFNILALSSFALSDFSYPVYILLINLIMVLLILRPQITRLAGKKHE